MKPIIVDMKDMSDSTEVYEAKPNRFIVYTIYLILMILIVAVLWMRFSKIDIVVRSNGVFKGSNAVYEISSGVTGTVKETHVENGQYVKEGDILYILTIEELSDTILSYQNEFNAVKDRLEILSAYEKSLDGDKTELETMTDNPYYDELINRMELLYANVDANKNDADGQITMYKGNVDSLSETIEKYKEKIDKLNTVKRCVTAQNNTFNANESIYYSIVSSYIASYNYTALQYDNKINEYQKQIDKYEEQLKRAEAEVPIEVESIINEGLVSDSDLETEASSSVIQ